MKAIKERPSLINNKITIFLNNLGKINIFLFIKP